MINILTSNRFNLSPAFENDIESSIGSRNHHYYMSFSRSKGSGFINGLLSSTSSIHSPVFTMVIDGEKLSHKFRSIPVNYHKNFSKKSIVDRESEDRITSNKPFISPASDYIISIHAYVPNGSNRHALEEFYSLSQQSNIPAYFYKNLNAFRLLQTNRSVKIDQLILNDDTHGTIHDMVNPTNKDYMTLISILSKSPDKLNTEERKAVHFMASPEDRKRTGSRIISYLKNKSTSRKDVEQYFDILKNSGSTSIDDLLTKIVKVYGKA